ncbi:hypothetical protein CPB85DRAFT_1326320 [Mucidula mucida]|nr:hypothetical protein CPB85DRAFT_1326320 [Mucidula mucida]
MDTAAYISELEAKVHLLERFVRFLVLFGADRELLARAEEAMWAASSHSDSVSDSESSSVQTRMSSCEFAVDVDGFKTPHTPKCANPVEEICTPHLMKRAHLSQQQLEAIHSLEDICQRLSGTDLGSLEDSISFNLVSASRAISSTSFAVPLSPSLNPKHPSTPTGLGPSDLVPIDIASEPFKPLRIRAPISLDASPRKSRHSCASPRKPLSPLKPQPAFTSQKRFIAKPRASPRASPQSLKQSTVTMIPRKYIPTPPTTLKRTIKRKSPPPLATTNPLKEICARDTFSSNQSRQVHVSSGTPFERPSLYKPTLSSSMKGGKAVRRAHVKRKSLAKVF